MNFRIISVLAPVAILVCGATLLQAKDNPMGIAPKQPLMLSQPTVVAGTLLSAAEYKVTHEMQGQTHIMIFQQIGGEAEAKAKCDLVPLAEKASESESRFTPNAKNERVLAEITFRGDKAKHVFEQKN